MKKFLSYKSVLVFVITIYYSPFTIYCLFATGVGTTGGQFLKIYSGVRPASMGNVFIGMCDDVNSVNYNPAGLGFLTGSEILLMHNKWFEEINIEHILVSHNLENIGTFGLTSTLLTMDKIDKYDNTGTALNETYTASDLAAGVCYSRLINADLSVGFVLKLIQQKIENEKAQTFVADLGLLYRGLKISEGEKVLPVGVSVRNIATEIKFIKESAALPMLVSVGVSYKPIKSLTTAVDIRYSIEQQLTVGLGFEQTLNRLIGGVGFCIRVGYDTTIVHSRLDGLAGISAGLGVQTKLVNIDFAWVPYGDMFGSTYRIGLTIKLGK